MKRTSALWIALLLPLQTAANPLTAPSALPGGAAVPMQTAPVAAPVSAPVWKRPVSATTPAEPSAKLSPASPPAALQAGSNSSAPLSPKELRNAAASPWVSIEAETGEAAGGHTARFAQPDLSGIKRNLAARFAGLSLDENDRAELKLNTETFAQWQRSPSEMRAPSERMAPTIRRFMDQQSAPRAEQIDASNVGKAKLAIAPDHWCKVYLQNQPRISKLLIEAQHLTPGMAFVLKGVCLGDQPGSVEVRFPNERTVQARVLDWAADKVFVELPDITGVPPSTIQIVAITADRRLSPPKAYDFWPNWVLVDVPMHLAQVAECAGFDAKPYVRARCIAGNHDVKSHGYEVPSAIFGVGGAPMRGVPLWVSRYSEKVLSEDQVGWDTFTLNLPPWAHLQSWQASGHRLPNGPKTKVLRYEWDANTRRFTAKWQLVAPGYWGFLEYWVSNFKAWVPVGMRLD